MHRGGERTAFFQDVPDVEAHRNESYTFTLRVRASQPDAVFLSVDDGVIPRRSPTNRSAGGWEELSVSSIVSRQATQLRLHVWMERQGTAELKDTSFRSELRPRKLGPATLDDLIEDIPDEQLPPLDRKQLDESRLTGEQRSWRERGVVILRRFLPERLIDAYCRVREKLEAPSGYASVNPYHEVEEMRDLCLHPDLTQMLEHLIGEPMGLSLALTGWVSTERNWHQDDYLNPPSVNAWYAAAWIALDDIDADAGPFEYVPGSHRWPIIRRDRLLDYLDPEERTKLSWPKTSEELLVPLLERKLAESGLPSERFVASKGDTLIWHARLLHRGSKPRKPGLLRKSLIAHFTSIHRLVDAPGVNRHKGQGFYF